jgi:N-acetylmuramoyl-L-alanine amidase
MKIVNHRLCEDDGTPCNFVRSPNRGGTIEAEYLVMHYTAGRSAESSVNWLINPNANASAHVVIGADGSISQLVAFNRKAWHAGKSRWGGKTGLNGFSIGIELDNPGVLSKRNGGWFTHWGDRVDGSNVVEAVHKNGGPMRGWHAYSGLQLERAIEVASVLARHYDLKDILGHEDVSPGRKTDPGPAFPMDSFQSRVLGRIEEEPEVFKTITNLNIRRGAGTHYDKLSVSPLPTGTKLEVIATQGSWRLVDVLDTINNETDVQGWVHGRYITRLI